MSILHRIFGDDLTDMLIFEKGPEDRKKAGHVAERRVSQAKETASKDT